MTPDELETEATPAAPPDLDDPDSGPKQLREALKKSQAEVARLQSQAMTDAYAALGLDPEQGVGKAVAVTLDG
jgi:hypothetical protein